MPSSGSYEIRLCKTCGLRYPLMAGSSFGTRCPVCLGSTEILATHPFRIENRFSLEEPGTHLEVLLDNIRSAWNVGSIFRTADGFGVKHIHLCGITPTPEVEAVRKTSLRAEDTVGWTYHKNAVIAAQELKAKGYKLLALEEDKKAVAINEAHLQLDNEKPVLILGNEVTGVDPELLDLCDEILFIPMRGSKRSFNVAIAFGIALSKLAQLD